MHHLNRPQITKPNSFAKYCTISLSTCALATTESQAEVVIINLANVGTNNQDLTGTNAGIINGLKMVYDPCGSNSGMWGVYSNANYIGIFGNGSMNIATNGFQANPKNFTGGNLIDGSSSFTTSMQYTLFKFNTDKSVDFGANSYLGFRFSRDGINYNYGYIEATWSRSSNQFQFLSGAYENQAGLAILAGSTISVPEPGTLALGSLALLAGGGAAVRRYRKQRQGQPAPVPEEANPSPAI